MTDTPQHGRVRTARGGKKTMAILSRTSVPVVVDTGRMGDVLLEVGAIVYAIGTDEAIRIASELADAVETVRRTHQ